MSLCDDAAQASIAVECASLNTKLSALEPLVEPWRLEATVNKAHGVRDPSFTVHASELHVNVSKGLVNLLETEPLFVRRGTNPALLASAAARAAIDGRSVKVVNCCGVLLRMALVASRSCSSSSSSSSPSSSSPPSATATESTTPVEWLVLPESASSPADAVEMQAPAASSSSSAGGAGSSAGSSGAPAAALWVAFALPGSRVVSQLRLRHDGAHALSLRRDKQAGARAAHAMPPPPPAGARHGSGAGGGGDGGGGNATDVAGSGSGVPSSSRLSGHAVPMVCEVSTSADGTTLVKVRSTLRLRNKCASPIDVVCTLFAPTGSTARSGRRQSSDDFPSGAPKWLYDTSAERGSRWVSERTMSEPSRLSRLGMSSDRLSSYSDASRHSDVDRGDVSTSESEDEGGFGYSPGGRQQPQEEVRRFPTSPNEAMHTQLSLLI